MVCKKKLRRILRHKHVHIRKESNKKQISTSDIVENARNSHKYLTQYVQKC